MLVYVQVLRFLAAFAVVAFHAWGVAPEGYKVPDGVASVVLAHGGHGVDLFFVISGFIIFYATHRSPVTAGEFLRRRVERIVPLYWLVTLAVTLLGLTLPDVFGTPGWLTLRHVLKSLAFVSFTGGEMPVVYVGWSLEFEMYFYFAAALLMALTKNVWRNIVVLFSALVIAGQGPGVAAAAGPYAFFADPLILEFVLGVIVGMAFVNGRVAWPALAAAICAICVILAVDAASRVIASGIPSACLVAAAVFASRKHVAHAWFARALARLGDASYSIYLAQVNTVWLATMSLVALIPGIPPLLLVLSVSVIVAAFGLALNILVERPVLKLARRLDGSRRDRPGNNVEGLQDGAAAKANPDLPVISS
ncbi:MAG: acyltransferase [Bradyrhizobium icense]|nr:MAG: acyltransferase [Bradyrhizobium icense]